MMGLSMGLMKVCIIDPILLLQDVEPAFSTLNFLLLVLSTVLIAAGGYIVNDYLDTDIDEVNKPRGMVIGRDISKKAAWNLYVAVTLLGLAAAVPPAFTLGNVNYLLVQIIAVGLLWFYSYSYKRQSLIGNLVISGLSALVLGLPGYYELLTQAGSAQVVAPILFFLKVYVAFAFLTTFAREIIKDMEDVEGDKSAGCRTLPIVAGIVPAKIVAILFSLAVMAAAGYIQYLQYESQDYISLIYFAVAVQLPSLWLILKTAFAKEKADFRFASRLSKLVMLGGILSMLIFRLTLPMPEENANEAEQPQTEQQVPEESFQSQ